MISSAGTLSFGKNVIVEDYIHPRGEDHGVFVIAYTTYDDKSLVPVTN